MKRRKAFRPHDAGARQRFIHWALFTLGLVCFVLWGFLGFDAYFLGLLLLHVRRKRVTGRNVMDWFLDEHRRALGESWRAFAADDRRKQLSLSGPRSHRAFAIFATIALFVLSVVLGASVGFEEAWRAAIALVASPLLWFAYFGLGRRTNFVFGTDGVRVGDRFVPYATATGFRLDGDRVVVERSAPHPPVTVAASSPEMASRLRDLMAFEKERADKRRAKPSAPIAPAGFREHASQEGWRARVFDAVSDDERRAVIARVAPDDLHELLDEIADPALEEAVRSELERVKD